MKGSIGYLESLLRGRGQFEDLWSREELNTNIPERNADRVSAFDLVLKDCYSRDYQNRYVVGSQFTTRSLAGTGMKNMSTLITGRTLLKMAQHALLNWKKALAFGSQFLLPDGTLPSGNNVEDYDNHVLNHMFRYLKGRTSYSDPANDEDEDDDEEEILGAAVALNDDVGMPVDYYFHGWIGFKLFGPFAGDEFKSILLLTKDCVFENGKKESAGRASARKLVAEERSFSRASDMSIDCSIGSRGQLKVEDESVEAAKLALSEDLINNSIVGNALFGLSQSAACTRDRMKGLLQQQARYPLEHIMFANIQTKLDILDGKLESITNQIDSLSSQRTRKRENIVDEYYSKKSRFMSSSSPLSDDIPNSSPFSPVNDLGILSMTTKDQQLGDIISHVARRDPIGNLDDFVYE